MDADQGSTVQRSYTECDNGAAGKDAGMLLGTAAFCFEETTAACGFCSYTLGQAGV